MIWVEPVDDDSQFSMESSFDEDDRSWQIEPLIVVHIFPIILCPTNMDLKINFITLITNYSHCQH